MLARSTSLKHPLGLTLETPLLVPSFSSKGLKFNLKGESEVTGYLGTTTKVLTESMLVSAYDIYYGYIPKEYLSGPEIIFVDSGGYETSDEHDLSTVFSYPYPIKEWNETLLRSVLDGWPGHIPAVFVNFDHGSLRKSLLAQIDAARKFFERYPTQLHAIIIKPEKRSEITFKRTLSSIINNIKEFAHFDILGVTEKELGNSLFMRMLNVAKIRIALDKAGIKSPIQIFGSLDLLSSCLYFLAGAEIFDGLTWMRYSYFQGMAIYSQNYISLSLDMHKTDDTIRTRWLVNNIYELYKLRYEMKEFLFERDFSKFRNHGCLLKKYYDELCAKLRRKT